MIWLLLACRPAPIERSNNPWFDAVEQEDPSANDYDPYQEGEERLSLGLFYEGGFSEEIPIDDQNSSFYIWVIEGTSVPTFTQLPSYDAVEGILSDELVASEAGWFGGGLSWTQAQDLSKWETLHLSVRTESEALEGFKIGMGGPFAEGGSCVGSGIRQNWVSLSDYGFLSDGEWHHLEIPLYDFTICLDLAAISEPFNLLIAPLDAGDAGKSIFFDKLFFTVD